MSRRRLPAILLGAAGVVVCLLVLASLRKASRTLHESSARVAAEAELRFVENTVNRGLPAGFETLSAPARFRDFTAFGGRLVVCGAAGLHEYDDAGRLLKQHRAGLELPPAPLVALARSGDELWIATAGEGLLAWDTRRFRQVRPEDTALRDVTALLPLSTGGLLFGTRKGILRFDGRRMRMFHPSLAGENVTSLAGEEQDLWVGTLESGLLHLRAGSLERFGEPEGLPDRRVVSLAGRGDTIWAGTPAGIAEFRRGKFHRGLAPGYFVKSMLAVEGELLAGTLEDGLLRVPLEARHSRARAGFAGVGAIERVAELEGTVYVLTPRSLLAIEARGGRREVLETSGPLLADGNVAALAADDSGRLWVGYFDRGLDILDAAASRAVHYEDDSIFCVNRVAVSPGRGTVAVATSNGLALFDRSGARRQVLTRAEGLIASHVTDVAFTGRGLVAATPAGITFVDEGGPRSLFALHGLVNNHVYTLGSSGAKLLAGTLGGLTVLEGEMVRAGFTTANSGLKHNWITALASADPEGNDWFVGTYGAGVLRFDGSGGWSAFSDLPDKFIVNPNAMLATSRAIYAGTLGRGLAAWSRASRRWTWIAAGLPSLNVTALAERRGVLYIGTENGLVRVPESSLGVE